MKFKKIVVFMLIVIPITFISACGDSPKNVNSNIQTSPTEEGFDKDTDEETLSLEEEEQQSEEELQAAEIEKYNAYINVNNFMGDRLQTVISGYFRRVEEKKEFQMIGTDYWCNSLGKSYYEIINTANEYISKEPSFGTLDTAYEKLYPVLKKMMKAFDEIYDYGELETYLDDDYAGAKKLHAKVWKYYEKYIPLAETFFDEIEKLADKQREETLKELKEKGYEVRYSIIETISLGQDIQNFFYDNDITDANLLDTDLKKLDPLYKEFVKAVKVCYENIKDEEKLKKEGISSVSMFESALKDAKVSMSKLYKRIKDKKEVEEYEVNTAFPREDTIAGFNEKLGELISNYNSLTTYNFP